MTPPDRPNILLIMTDQQRWDALGCYGQRAIQTPHLDRLAAQGARFEHCYTPNPICTPARASLMTGKHIFGHGVGRLYDVLPDDEILFPARLRAAGYQTALFGKLHVSSGVHEQSHRHPHDGFDIYEYCLEASVGMESPYNGYVRWLGERNPAFLAELRARRRGLKHIPQEYHLTHWAAARTIDYIRTAAPGRPFFCMMSVFDPHNPYDQYPAEYAGRVDSAQLPTRIPLAAGDEEIYALEQERRFSYLGPADGFTSADIAAMRHGYYASLALIDDEVGRVLAALDEQGLADNTLVIFTSDHGDSLGDHGLFVKGVQLYDEAIRVPLLMRWPGHIPAGQQITALTQLHDLAATILAAARLPEPAAMTAAADLLPLCTGAVDAVHPYVTCAYRNSGINDAKRYFDPPIDSTMIRDDRYKLVIYHGVAALNVAPALQLFDMVADPHEQQNLAGDRAHDLVTARLLAALADWLNAQAAGRLSLGGEALPGAAWKQSIDNRY